MFSEAVSHGTEILEEIGKSLSSLRGLAVAGIAALTIVGCGPTTNKDVQLDLSKESITWNNLSQGIYTIDVTQWPEGLVQFKKDHPELEISAIYADKEGAYGSTSSVVIVTQPKCECAETPTPSGR